MFGMAGGNSQVFDMLVDREGNYLLVGHTTVGDGVVNWDYLALKINSQTRKVEWRKSGMKGGNIGGEWLSVDYTTGDVMIFTDSDTDGGFGFLKLTPNQ